MSDESKQVEHETSEQPHHHDPDRMPLKPILKQHSAKSLNAQAIEMAKEGVKAANDQSKMDESGGVTWDEPTIAEHDKLRGTRTKITEPKTPYHGGGSGANSDDESMALSSSTSAMDVDHETGSNSSRGESPRHTRFSLPQSHKRRRSSSDPAKLAAIHHQLAESGSDHTTSKDTSTVSTTKATDDESLGLDPSKERKMRVSADPISEPSLDVGNLQNRMEQVKEERRIDDARAEHATAPEEEPSEEVVPGEESDSDDNEFLTPQERAKKDAFAEKRKRHYDEYKRVQEFMNKHDSLSSSDEDEDAQK